MSLDRGLYVEHKVETPEDQDDSLLPLEELCQCPMTAEQIQKHINWADQCYKNGESDDNLVECLSNMQPISLKGFRDFFVNKLAELNSESDVLSEHKNNESDATNLYNKLRDAFIQPLSVDKKHEVFQRNFFVYNAVIKENSDSKDVLDANAQLRNLNLMLAKLQKLQPPSGSSLERYLKVARRELDEKKKDLVEKYQKCAGFPYSEGLLKDEIINATRLAFCLVFKVKALIATEGDALECGASALSGRSFESMNDESGKKFAEKLSHFNGWKFAAGIAIAIFGIAVGATVGVAVAASVGATFGATGVLAPIFITMAKFGLDAVAASVCYLVAELVLGKHEIKTPGQFAAATLGGIVSVPTGVAALARGIHTMWTSRAVSANNVLALTKQDANVPAAPARKV